MTLRWSTKLLAFSVILVSITGCGGGILFVDRLPSGTPRGYVSFEIQESWKLGVNHSISISEFDKDASNAYQKDLYQYQATIWAGRTGFDPTAHSKAKIAAAPGPHRYGISGCGSETRNVDVPVAEGMVVPVIIDLTMVSYSPGPVTRVGYTCSTSVGQAVPDPKK